MFKRKIYISLFVGLLFASNLYAYQIVNHRFIASGKKLSLEIPAGPNLKIEEVPGKVYTVAFKTGSRLNDQLQLVTVIVPLTQKMYPGWDIPDENKKLLNSLGFRMQALAKANHQKLTNLKCHPIKVGDKEANRCASNSIIPSPSSEIITRYGLELKAFEVGTIFIDGNSVVHVYGIQPAAKPFNYRAYNNFLNSIKMNH